ncbi:phage holin [Bacillus sp. DX1.1]|uniref:phage holin n=1 Tax=unclassified Bacillus (in: firmicutes) TaxID=185979 RepID=UPI002570EAF5|nr:MULTISPECIES: phage holin [unclassified Bacillus (in: firmicutes)]MDM5156187.1 phage holin [Bacillus sp. DX1.1]WJE80467.1 phage holin [Bacillus sp. DX3.1]
MIKGENVSDIIRFIAGFLLSLKLLFESFGLTFITNDQIDAIVNVASFLFILYFGYKNNYIGKKGLEQKELLKKHNLH